MNSSTHHLGFQVLLRFIITQHSRDEQLMRSLVEYLGCGNVYRYKEVVVFKITKIDDLNDKVIPFFSKFPIQGIKELDFIDFCKAVKIINKKDHLTKDGLEKIIVLKQGMNRGRTE
jgi:hypothetical protein